MLVVARMVGDVAYARLVLDGRHPVTGAGVGGDSVEERFAREVLAMHRRTTGPVDVRGSLQLPWPRFLGTPPWAVARQLSGTAGRAGAAYRTHVVLPWRRRAALDDLLAAARAGHPVPLYVGNRWSPRHVVLVLDEGLVTYDPATGGRVPLRRDDFEAGRVGAGRWSVPWFVVRPPRGRPGRAR